MVLLMRYRYEESIDLLYSEHLFEFNERETFVQFATSVPHEHFLRIQRLHLNFFIVLAFLGDPTWQNRHLVTWKAVWQSVADMKGLKSLVVYLRCPIGSPPVPRLSTEDEFPILRPLWLVRQVPAKDFDLTVNWATTENYAGHSDAPFGEIDHHLDPKFS